MTILQAIKAREHQSASFEDLLARSEARLSTLEHFLDIAMKDDNGTCACEQDCLGRQLLAEREQS